MSATERAKNLSWTRLLWSFVGIFVAYYAFPVEWGQSLAIEVASLALTVAGLGLLALMMIRELQRIRRGQEGLGVPAVCMLLILLVMSFAMAFFLVDVVDTDQFKGLDTRTDALYFTLTTIATVGFGDIHAQGQLARIMVSFLIVFNLVVIASLARLYTSKPR